MKLKRISVVTLTLLTLVTACNSNESSKQEESAKTTIKDIEKDRPDRGKARKEKDSRSVCEALKQGPSRSSEHGPMDNTDLNRDGTVLREELETFMNQGEYRRVTLLTFFERYDIDKNGKLSNEEFSKVEPARSFDGTDANGDCIVTKSEVLDYVNEAGRSYRKIGLGEFFNLVDVNNDNKATPAEIEAAHESGLLARF